MCFGYTGLKDCIGCHVGTRLWKGKKANSKPNEGGTAQVQPDDVAWTRAVTMTRCKGVLDTFWKATGQCEGQRRRNLESRLGRRRVQLSAWRCHLLKWVAERTEGNQPFCLGVFKVKIYQRASKQAVINIIWNLCLRAKRDHA